MMFRHERLLRIVFGFERIFHFAVIKIPLFAFLDVLILRNFRHIIGRYKCFFLMIQIGLTWYTLKKKSYRNKIVLCKCRILFIRFYRSRRVGISVPFHHEFPNCPLSRWKARQNFQHFRETRPKLSSLCHPCHLTTLSTRALSKLLYASVKH